jgi:transposase InsO family protein
VRLGMTRKMSRRGTSYTRNIGEARSQFS